MNLFSNDRKKLDDTAASYDKYYEGGSESIYNKRFGNKRLLLREKQIVLAAAKRILKLRNGSESVLKILDFGCGDGRYFQAFNQLAKFCSRRGIQLELTSYDLSLVGLINYRQQLLNIGFNSELGINHNNDLTQGYILDVLSNNQIKIRLIYGVASQQHREIQLLLGMKEEYDLIISMFGVLSHIPGRDNRIQMQKIFYDILKKNGLLVITLPMLKDFENEYKAFQVIRTQAKILSKIGIHMAEKFNYILEFAREDGDIYYCKSDDKHAIQIFYHIYKVVEALEDLMASSFRRSKVGVCCILHPGKLSSSQFKRWWDYIASKILSSIFCPFALMEKFASYIVVISEKGE